MNANCFLAASISITSLHISDSATLVFTMSCISNGSIPTLVSWSKNGTPLMLEGDYYTEQTLLNGVQVTYDNSLLIMTPLGEVAGNYTCTTVNSHDDQTSSASSTLSIYGE